MRGLLIAALALFASVQNAQAGQLWLTMDRVHPHKVDSEVDSIVVGNPAIADVTVRDSNNLLLFGRSPGLTNIYLFDQEGNVIDDLVIRVRTPNTDMLTVFRGSARTTYNCTTNCEATVTVGDDPTTFSGVAGQVVQKFGDAQTAANEDN